MTVRLPTDAEWEYAARVGTSNPCFTEKYKDQISEAGSRPTTAPVRSKKPNAWGLYDMLCGGWHVTNDYKADNVRVKQVDPKGPARERQPRSRRRHRPTAQDPRRLALRSHAAEHARRRHRHRHDLGRRITDLPGRRRDRNSDLDQPLTDPPELRLASNNIDCGVNFQSVAALAVQRVC